MMNWLAEKWLKIRDRPLAILGVVLAGFVLMFIAISTVDTTRRIFTGEHPSPCDDFTTEECALKLYTALSPAQRKKVIDEATREIRAEARRRERRRKALIRQERIRRAQGNGSGGCSPGCPSGDTSPAPDTGQPGSSAGPKQNTSTKKKPSQSQNGSGGGNTGDNGGGGGGTSQPSQPSVVTTPAVTVPGVLDVPALTVPCITVLGRSPCETK